MRTGAGDSITAEGKGAAWTKCFPSERPRGAGIPEESSACSFPGSQWAGPSRLRARATLVDLRLGLLEDTSNRASHFTLEPRQSSRPTGRKRFGDGTKIARNSRRNARNERKVSQILKKKSSE